MSRHLLQRLPKPALGRGHVQQAALRALVAGNGVATTAEVLEWTCAMKRHQWRPIFKADYQIARRALDRIADRIGRAGGSARPIIWRLKNR
jgi:hypothetical protein